DDMSSLQSTELFQQQAYINGQWLAAQSNATVPVSNPATGEEIDINHLSCHTKIWRQES
ncbi:hypothetical protein IAF28_20850, partial [Acinetobacter baumannii]|nr:hypothetical protein [Acinetobacter baumannii]